MPAAVHLFALAFAFLVMSPWAIAEGIDYEKNVKSVLAERCFACHGALKQEAGLRLDTVALMTQGGDTGPAIVPGQSKESLIWSRISSTDPDLRMPPEGEPLKQSQLDAISQWIESGAHAPSKEEPEQDPEKHWSFQSPVRPAVPTSNQASQTDELHPIDAFLLEKQLEAGVAPVGLVDKRLWLRRVTLDLIGLPPNVAEQIAFLEDDSPDARMRVIDRLLESPQYGERWGRHWMDIWRYSDWWGLGAEVRNSQKHMWHWRDWIIESLNQDKGYDQMILEMLAADELYPEDASKLRATGYLARQYFKFNRTTWMDETIEHTFKGMLGLTANCSKCHDHKYDPITQENYYELRAIFEPYQVRMDVAGDELDLQKDGIPRAFDCNLDTPTYVHIRGDERNPKTDKAIEPKVPDFLASTLFEIQPVKLPARAVFPGLREDVVAAYRKKAMLQQKAAAAAIEVMEKDGDTKSTLEREIIHLKKAIADQELQSIELRHAADRIRYLGEDKGSNSEHTMADAAWSVRQLAVLQKELARKELEMQLAKESDDKKKGELSTKLKASIQQFEEAQKNLESVGHEYPSLIGAEKTAESNVESEESRKKPFPNRSTGRRAALARWIANEKNPLTARVAVNHIWARHFGAPLVPTVFDFGRKGASPTHPELLDWLAVEFMESGWSMKHMHRLMLMSSLYARTSSSKEATADTLRSDRDNRLYWRMNPVRMESQVIRDSLLALAGELDTTMGGPSVPVNNTGSKRRSLYYIHSKNERNKLLSVFDDANVLDCYRRASSIVPQQSLALENSEMAQELAIKIANQMEPASSDRDFIASAFRKVLGYEPNDQEFSLSLRFLQRQKEGSEGSPDSERDTKQSNSESISPKAAFLLALLNHNDFITIR